MMGKPLKQTDRRIFLKLAGVASLFGFCKTNLAVAKQTVAKQTGSRFQEGPNTVTDMETGLMWEKKLKSGSDDWRKDLHSVHVACTWAEATGGWIDAVNEERFEGFSDWRLPSVHELITIIDYAQTKPPAIDPVFGPVVSAFYWTATPLGFRPGLAWNIFFLDGVVFVDDKGNKNRVRAVRSIV